MKIEHILLILSALAFFVVGIFIQENRFSEIQSVQQLRHNEYSERLVNSLDINIAFDGLALTEEYLYMSTGNELMVFDLSQMQQEATINYPTQHLEYNGSSEILYAVARGGNTNSLIALDKNNNVIWENNSQSFTRIAVKLLVESIGESYAILHRDGVVKINPDTGEFSQPTTLPNLADDTLPHIAGGHFWQIIRNQLVAHPTDVTQGVMWQSSYTELPSGFLRQVWANEEVVLLRLAGYLWLLDRDTGDLIWNYNDTPIASNFSVIDDEIIILDINANLLWIDIISGEVSEIMEFESPLDEAQDNRISSETIGSSLVEVNSEYIVIFFGDTDTVSIFSIQD